MGLVILDVVSEAVMSAKKLVADGTKAAPKKAMESDVRVAPK